MLVGDPPFYSESLVETYGMVMNHKKALQFRDDIQLSPEVVDLIKSLICDREERLTVAGIRAHPFFKDVDWDSIRAQMPPYVPELKGPDDTSNFDEEFDDVRHASASRRVMTSRAPPDPPPPFCAGSHPPRWRRPRIAARWPPGESFSARRCRSSAIRLCATASACSLPTTV
jgi:serine/threonine protein kinase